MIIDLPHTTIPDLTKRLVSIREETGAMALGRVMTLLVVAQEDGLENVIRAASEGTRQHPSRIVVVVAGNRRGTNRLDAQIRVGGDAGAGEFVILRLFGELTRHGESVVMPLLLADSPIVAWWPGVAPRNVAEDAIGSLAQRRITDAESQPDPVASMKTRARYYRPGDTDLAWTRTTRWRGLLASLLDENPSDAVLSAGVLGSTRSASADLLAGWLATRLSVPVSRTVSSTFSGIYGVTLARESGETSLIRPDGVMGVLERPNRTTRRVALPRRIDPECLADELSRLDADEIYAQSLRDGIPRVTYHIV